MVVEPSGIPGIVICGHNAPEFAARLDTLVGSAPKSLPETALPYSVILTNASPRTVAFIGVRFDMTPPHGQLCSVVHYADTLRNPAKADFVPGTHRFFCAEPAYTALVLKSDAAGQSRARLNLDNLRRMTQIAASLDCIAFADGEFAGTDSQGAFDRLAEERRAETEFLECVIASSYAGQDSATALLVRTAETSDRSVLRAAARKLILALDAAGVEGVRGAAQNFRHRIELRR